MNDFFGFNLNGYFIERMFFFYDVIEGVFVEIVFFDVIYGGFLVCNISVVSKMGINEVYGIVFYDYGSDSLCGDLFEGDDVNLGFYIEKCYGFSVGVLLIEDMLFIFVVYEKFEGVNIFDCGVIGIGVINEVVIL